MCFCLCVDRFRACPSWGSVMVSDQRIRWRRITNDCIICGCDSVSFKEWSSLAVCHTVRRQDLSSGPLCNNNSKCSYWSLSTKSKWIHLPSRSAGRWVYLGYILTENGNYVEHNSAGVLESPELVKERCCSSCTLNKLHPPVLGNFEFKLRTITGLHLHTTVINCLTQNNWWTIFIY